jgi:multiple sugar transport system ATP-binding protein
MAEVVMDHLTKRYPDGFEAVKDMSLDVQDGEFVILVGPSGSGKSTALKMIAGLEDITDGELRIGEEVVNGLAPKDRDIAMVFQNYALYPHMTVRENLAFPLTLAKVPDEEVTEKVEEAAKILDLTEHLDRKPANLSGGQRQRVAMGRAIVRDPKAFLLDEPLSNLDAKLRVAMRASLAQLHQKLGVTTVYVTHDQVEAMTLGQRVAVMRDGRILQVDTPQTLYEQPLDLFVAGFIGSPAMNLVEATVADGEVAFGQLRLPLDPSRRPVSFDSGRVILGIRPETFEDATFAAAELPAIDVEVVVLEELGSDAHVFFRVDATRIAAETLGEDDDTTVDLVTDRGSLLNARVDPRTMAIVGGTLRLAVDPSRFHFFDPDTGSSLLSERASELRPTTSFVPS